MIVATYIMRPVRGVLSSGAECLSLFGHSAPTGRATPELHPCASPTGTRRYLWTIPNIEYFSLQERPGGYGAGGKVPDVVMWCERDYGNQNYADHQPECIGPDVT